MAVAADPATADRPDLAHHSTEERNGVKGLLKDISRRFSGKSKGKQHDSGKEENEESIVKDSNKDEEETIHTAASRIEAPDPSSQSKDRIIAELQIELRKSNHEAKIKAISCDNLMIMYDDLSREHEALKSTVSRRDFQEFAQLRTEYQPWKEGKQPHTGNDMQIISRLESELSSIEEQLEKERRENYQLKKKVASLGNANKQLTEHIESCQFRIENYLSQLQSLERENKQLCVNQGALEESNEVLKQALESLHSSVNTRHIKFDVNDYNYGPEIQDYLNWVCYGIVDKWQSFAYQLKLSDGTVRTISAMYGSKPLECCREVFIEWKNNCTSPFTWSTILRALVSPAVDRTLTASFVVQELNKIHFC